MLRRCKQPLHFPCLDASSESYPLPAQLSCFVPRLLHLQTRICIIALSDGWKLIQKKTITNKPYTGLIRLVKTACSDFLLLATAMCKSIYY